MSKNIKIVLQYAISLAIAAALMWYVFRDVNVSDVVSKLKAADFKWIVASFFVGTLSHFSRAYRWNILYQPLGYKPTLFHSFIALMSGYFLNLLIPRAGEVTRCGVMLKVEKVPIASSFGTVITERVFDLLMLMLLFLFAFTVEFNRLSNFFISLFSSKIESAEKLTSTFLILATLGAIMAGLTYFLFRSYREKIIRMSIYQKVYGIAIKIWEGMISVRHIKQKGAFVFHTFAIWALYYLTAYLITFSLPQTSNLSMMAVFAVFLMGSLGMAAPVQGGIGAVHILVSGVLVLYGIPESEGLLFATLMHAATFIFTFAIGALCLLLSFILNKNKPVKVSNTTHEHIKENI